MVRFEPVFFDIETTGLNPLQKKWWNGQDLDAQVISVGIGTIKHWDARKADMEKNVKVFTNPDEYAMMNSIGKDTIDFIEQSLDIEVPYPGETAWSEEVQPFFVGWNNRNFDHDYMGARFAHLRLESYPFTHGWKRLDGMNAIQSKTGRMWSQDDWMEEIGVMHEDDITGSDVPDMFQDGHIDKIHQHCKADIHDLMDIFIEDRYVMMQEFYDHYDIPHDPDLGGEVEL